MCHSACDHQQMQISALLDDELTADELLPVLDHLVGCPDCAAFYRDGRRLQETTEHMQTLPEALPQPVAIRRRPIWMIPSFAGAAVAVIAALLLVWPQPSPITGSELETGVIPVVAETPNTVHLIADDANMDEVRFVQMAVELLQADVRYQRKMSEVLTQIAEDAPERWQGAL